MKFNLSILLFVFLAMCTSCAKFQASKDNPLLAKGFSISKPLSIQEMWVRSKVIKLAQKNKYSLSFGSSSTNQILSYKPTKIQIKLPYFGAPSFFVSLGYKDDQILSDFSFPEGWIDSAELEGIFYINKTSGWKVPMDSIYSPFGESQYVIKVSDGKSAFVPIEVIKLNEDGVVVTGNLKEGDTLITSRHGEIVSGMSVKVSL